MPKPVLHVAGTSDALVNCVWQEQMIAILRRTNGRQPVETFLHDGDHSLPPEAGVCIARFFRSR